MADLGPGVIVEAEAARHPDPRASGPGGHGVRDGQGGGIGAVAVYLVSFVSLGLSFSLIGPALSHMQDQVGTTVGAIGVLFTVQAFGYLVGSIAGGSLYDRGLGHRVLGSSLLLVSVALLAIPHAGSLLALSTMFGLVGLGSGSADVGGNTLLVWRRGGSDGAALNGLHLCFGIGALASPVLVAWSLSARGDLVASSLAMAVPTAAVGIWALLQPSPAPLRHEDHARGVPASRSTLLVVSVFFFLYVGVEIGFAGWVHTYAQAINLGGDATAAALNATFWGAFLLGRFFAVGVATRCSAGRMLAVAGGLSIGGAAVLAVSGGGAALVWSGTVLFGLAIAPLYPTMLAYVGDHVLLTGTATSWFVAGSAVGGLTLPWLIGQLFDHLGPSAMPVTVLIATVLCVAWILVIRAHPRPTAHQPCRHRRSRGTRGTRGGGTRRPSEPVAVRAPRVPTIATRLGRWLGPGGSGGGLVGWDTGPHREADVLGAEVLDDATLGVEVAQARPGRVHAARHHDVVGDRQQQRTAGRVGVALAQHGLDLEHGPARLGRVRGPAVVHHALEHRQHPDPHDRIIAPRPRPSSGPHQWRVPGAPLNGPTTREVIQPP